MKLRSLGTALFISLTLASATNCKPRTFNAKSDSVKDFFSLSAEERVRDCLAKLAKPEYAYPSNQVKTLTLGKEVTHDQTGRVVTSWGEMGAFSYAPSPTTSEEIAAKRKYIDYKRYFGRKAWKLAKEELPDETDNEKLRAKSSEYFKQFHDQFKHDNPEIFTHLTKSERINRIYQRLADSTLELMEKNPQKWHELQAEVFAKTPSMDPKVPGQKFAYVEDEKQGITISNQILNFSDHDVFMRLLFMDRAAWNNFVEFHIQNGVKDNRLDTYFPRVMMAWTEDIRNDVKVILKREVSGKDANGVERSYETLPKHIELPEAYVHKGPKRMWDLFSSYALRPDLWFPAKMKTYMRTMTEEAAAKKTMEEWFAINKDLAGLTNRTSGKGSVTVDELRLMGLGVADAMAASKISDSIFIAVGSTAKGLMDTSTARIVDQALDGTDVIKGGAGDIDGFFYRNPRLTINDHRLTDFQLRTEQEKIEVEKAQLLIADKKGNLAIVQDATADSEASTIVPGVPAGFHDDRAFDEAMTHAIRQRFIKRGLPVTDPKYIPADFDFAKVDPKGFEANNELVSPSSFVRQQRIGNSTQMNPVTLIFKPEGVYIQIIDMHDYRVNELGKNDQGFLGSSIYKMFSWDPRTR